MPKMTVKYKAALKQGEYEGLKQVGDELYKQLRLRGYWWHPESASWIYADEAEADAPAAVVRLRVWADAEIVADVAGDIAEQLKRLGFQLQEKSDVYPCRPPKQLEARVYLTFQPPSKPKGK